MQNTQNVNAGATPTFTVIVSGGSGSPFLAWQFLSSGSSGSFVSLSDGPQASGSTISGSSTTTLVISNVQSGDAGKYRCLISDTVGGATTNLNSGPSYLSVTTGLPFTITAPFPTPQSANAGATVSFEADVSGQSGILHRYWQFFSTTASPPPTSFSPLNDGAQLSGSTIVGSTLPILQITNSQPGDTGKYRQLVSDSVATPNSGLNSGPGTLTVNGPPGFTLSASPNSLTINQGGSGTISIAVNPSGGFSDSVTLTALNLPNGVMASFSPNPVVPPNLTGTLTLTASSTAQIFTGQQVTIKGTSTPATGSLVSDTIITLTVQAPPPAPPAPTQIYANPISTTEIDLSWKNPPGNFTIHIEREEAQSPPFGGIGTVDTSAPPVFQDKGLEPATTYLYRVRASDASGNYSPYSTIAINSTLVPVPTNLTSTSHTAPLIDLQWTNPFNGYTALHLYQNGPNDLTRFLVADLLGTATSYEFNAALPNTTYSFALQAEVSGKLSAFTSDLVVTAQGKVTIFFVHGTDQGAGDLDGLAATLESSIDPKGATYNFDTGFDWSRCTKTGQLNQRFPPTPFPAGEDQGVVPPPPPAPFIPLIPGFPPNPCPNQCNVSDGAYDLAHYIAQKNPPGDVFIVAYSLGGNVARDMIEGQQESNIGTPGHKLLGLVTLGTGNNGYPYEYPWDNIAICDGLAKEIASDIRSSPAGYPFNGQYIKHINDNWLASPLGGAGYQSFPWLAAAGTFCKSPIRFPDSTQNGCPAGSSNDGVVCADSALFSGVPGGSFNRPTSTFASDIYSHSADRNPWAQLLVFDTNNGDYSAFYNGQCSMPDHISLWNPGAGSSLAQQVANFILANTP
ncbi:MAG TPA: fibronectin type III domain-containing protein [Candidatus Angelobacter sp.]